MSIPEAVSSMIVTNQGKIVIIGAWLLNTNIMEQNLCLQCLWDPGTWPCAEQVHSSPHRIPCFFQIYFSSIFTCVSQVVSFLHILWLKFYMHFSSTCYLLWPADLPWFDNPNNI
jgi:hypothetical protein